MAKTTAAAFKEYSVAIKPSPETWVKVNDRRDQVVKVLKDVFPEGSPISYRSSQIMGSLGRNTATNPVADIDLLTVFDVDTWPWVSKYWWSSADFLYRVRRALNEKSTVKKVGARGQAVRFEYADGLHVDVAAVVAYSGGGYKIPDGSGHWLRTDPIRHEIYLNERNNAVPGDLKQLIRLAKQWNKAHGSHLSSFHLEMLVARTFNKLGANQRQALREFFDRNHHKLSIQDPAGYSGNLAHQLSRATKSSVNDNLKAARDHADLALEAEQRGDHSEAIRRWRIILGTKFPTYG